MKTRIVCAVFAAALCAASGAGLYAIEMQSSLGFETGIATYQANTDITLFSNDYSRYVTASEDTTSLFFASGLSYSTRIYGDLQPGAVGIGGVIVRGRTLFVTKARVTGTVSSRSNLPDPKLNFTEKVSETSWPFREEISISVSDISIGPAMAFGSGRVRLCLDYGFNVTWIDYEDFNEGDTFEYLGFGFFSQPALQFHFGEKMYLELGIAAMLNMFSSQRGEIYFSPRESVSYKDSGRWDSVSAAAYLHLGWKIDAAKYAAQTK